MVGSKRLQRLAARPDGGDKVTLLLDVAGPEHAVNGTSSTMRMDARATIRSTRAPPPGAPLDARVLLVDPGEQLAIVDEAGVQQRNRNLANDPAKLVPILGALRRAPRSPSRPRTAGIGWWSCWRS
jgi:hypothetical protein